MGELSNLMHPVHLFLHLLALSRDFLGNGAETIAAMAPNLETSPQYVVTSWLQKPGKMQLLLGPKKKLFFLAPNVLVGQIYVKQ